MLLVSFILGMMNAANIQLMKNQARIDVDSALYSLFGEYQTDLLEEYQTKKSSKILTVLSPKYSLSHERKKSSSSKTKVLLPKTFLCL